MRHLFRRLATRAADGLGSPWAFILAVGLVTLWVVSGPLFGFSDTWQLVINTGTTLVTFLAVFLIQNTQSREARVTQIKLDELIRHLAGPRDEIANAEDMSDEQLDALIREVRVRYGGRMPAIDEPPLPASST